MQWPDQDNQQNVHVVLTTACSLFVLYSNSLKQQFVLQLTSEVSLLGILRHVVNSLCSNFSINPIYDNLSHGVSLLCQRLYFLK